MGLHQTFGQNPPPPAGGRLTVFPAAALTNGQFRDTFGMAPDALYELVARGLPDAQVSVDIEPGGHACLSVASKVQGRTVFTAEDCALQRHAGILSIARDRDTEVRATDKGLGLGKIFLANMIALGEALGLRRIDMRAGRENGAWYWSYRGAQLDTDTNSVVYDRFERAVRDNMRNLPDGLQAKARAILDAPGADVNVRLARLGYRDGAALLSGTNPMVVFRLDDTEQVRDVKTALGDVEAARTALRARLAPAPAAGPAGP
jgi:hypothetical protein